MELLRTTAVPVTTVSCPVPAGNEGLNRNMAKPLTVLFYSDMESLTSHCVVAAEALRSQIETRIVLIVYDKRTHVGGVFENYEVHDFAEIFWPPKPPKVKPSKVKASGNAAQAAAADAGAASKTEAVAEPDRRWQRHFEWGHNRKRAVVYARRVRALLRWPFLYLARVSFTGQFVSQALRLRHFAASLRRFLQSIKPDVIVLAEDNVERPSTSLVIEGRKLGIPSIVIPFTIPNPLEGVRAYRDEPLHQVKGLKAHLFAKLCPKWRLQINGHDLLRATPAHALVLEVLGKSSPAPWILNRGGAARIALDSEAQRDLYLKLGFPPSQLSVVGDVHGEVLYRGLSNKSRLVAELLSDLGLPQGRPLILCAFPPDQYGGKTDDAEFKTYDALMEGWIGSFLALGDRANVLIRPHPRADIRRFERFSGPNVRVTQKPTAELVPLCDLYIASVSATIRWAISCGIPVINYDTYRAYYGDYDNAAGVIQTDKLDEFRFHLERFANDPAFAAEFTERQRKAAQYWGAVDGKLGERLAALVSEVAHAATA
jgi:hypothetical protein